MSETQTVTVPDLDKEVSIIVNERKVRARAGPGTGLEIKEYAIKSGVNIKPDFVLHRYFPNGAVKIVGDDDKVLVTDDLVFTAIAPDDNS